MGGGGIGVWEEVGVEGVAMIPRYSRPLLIANILAQPSYSKGVLKAPDACPLINYCSLICFVAGDISGQCYVRIIKVAMGSLRSRGDPSNAKTPPPKSRKFTSGND